MGTITIPTILSNPFTFGLRRGQKSIEMMTQRDVVKDSDVALWALFADLVVLSDADSLAWRGALAQLAQLENRFDFTPPYYSGPVTGYAGAAPVVDGAGAKGDIFLNVDGMTASTAIAKRGDYFSVNSEFKIFTKDVTADGDGRATILFEPKLRAVVADNTVTVIASPVVSMKLKNPAASWGISAPKFYHIKLDAIEGI